MVDCRQVLAILGFAALTLVVTPAAASDISKTSSKAKTPGSLGLQENLSLRAWDAESIYYRTQDYSILDNVTLGRQPPGSVITRYEGPHKLIVKYARRYVRKMWNEQIERETAYAPLGAELALIEQQRLAWANADTNGNWWERHWWEYLPQRKGGSAQEPIVRTVGSTIEWKIGFLSVTNTLRFKLDYLAVFNFEPDPAVQPDPRGLPIRESHDRFAVEVSPDHEGSSRLGTDINIKVRPHVRIGFPKGGDWITAFRRMSIRAEFEIVRRGKAIIKAECEVRYRAPSGFAFNFDVALLTW